MIQRASISNIKLFLALFANVQEGISQSIIPLYGVVAMNINLPEYEDNCIHEFIRVLFSGTQPFEVMRTHYRDPEISLRKS